MSDTMQMPARVRRPPGRPPGSISTAERYERLKMMVFAQSKYRKVINFWFGVMLDENRDMVHRIACSHAIMDRAYGRPVQIVDANMTENSKRVLEVRWLDPDPSDTSKVIEPEPD